MMKKVTIFTMAIFTRTHQNNHWLSEAGYTKKEQEDLYDNSVQDIIDNTRWYLDNLEYLREYRVYWQCYSKKRVNGTNSITLPSNKVNKRKVYK